MSYKESIRKLISHSPVWLGVWDWIASMGGCQWRLSLVDGWPTSHNIYREEDKKLSGQVGGGDGACLKSQLFCLRAHLMMLSNHSHLLVFCLLREISVSGGGHNSDPSTKAVLLLICCYQIGFHPAYSARYFMKYLLLPSLWFSEVLP